MKKWRQKKLEQSIEVIGIDHGWSMMKTANTIFTTGVAEIRTEPAIFDNVLEYDGKYYQVGGTRLTVQSTKVENENFYLLTLAAIAKELKARGKNRANVYLAVGLPYTRYGDEKQDFMEYLERNKCIQYSFEQKQYEIRIVKVSIYPQCYAAIVDKIPSAKSRVVAIDLGSWTLDIVDILNKSPNDETSVTIPKGLIKSMRSINSECYRLYATTLDECVIQEVMRFGTSDIDDIYLELIKEHLQKYTVEVHNAVRELSFNRETTQIIYVGGGASVMRLFSTEGDKRNISYVEDIKANAKGYELLAKLTLRKSGR